ncbi:hypothetical protein GGF50DRAFT_65506 [Schizophyllum commune]
MAQSTARTPESQPVVGSSARRKRDADTNEELIDEEEGSIPRRTKRRRKTREADVSEAVSFDEMGGVSTSADGNATSIPAKKRKAPASTKKGKASANSQPQRRRVKGSLERLTDMPFDILLEIFSHLDPASLLSITRTTKVLRALLLDKSTIQIWRDSLSRVDGAPGTQIPETPGSGPPGSSMQLPNDLSEPAFTALAFGHHCQFCASPHGSQVLWTARLRYCKNCIPEHFIHAPASGDMNKFAFKYPILRKPMEAREMIPSIEWKKSPFYFPKPHVERLNAEYMSLTGDPDALAKWKKEKKAEYGEAEEFSNRCELMEAILSDQRIKKQGEMRKARQASIESRLRALGLGADFDYAESRGMLNDMPHWKKTQPEMTDKADPPQDPCRPQTGLPQDRPQALHSPDAVCSSRYIPAAALVVYKSDSPSRKTSQPSSTSIHPLPHPRPSNMFATLLPLTLLATSLTRASPLEDRSASPLEDRSTSPLEDRSASPLQKRAGICDSAPLDAPAVEISQHGDSSKVWWVRDTSDYFFDYVDLAPEATNATQHIYHTWYLQRVNTQYDFVRYDDQFALVSAIAIKTKAISTNGANSLYGRQYTTLPDDTEGEILANKGFAWTMSCATCADELCLSCGTGSSEGSKLESCTFKEPFAGNCITTQANGTLTALPCDGSAEQLYDVHVVEA